MIKKISIAVAGLFMCVFAFTGCNSNNNGPSATDLVIGNGGVAVQKGDYLFYANGFEEYSSLESSHKNKTGSVEISSLYRAELDENGDVILNEDGEIENATEIVSKVVGFENSSINIFGSKIFFSSPNTYRDQEGNHHFDQLTFWSCNLDGSGMSELFSTESYSSTSTFFFNEIDGNVYLTILEGTTLKTIKAGSSAKILCEDVTSAVLCESTNSVLITRSRTSEEGFDVGITNNILESINIKTQAKVVIGNNSSETYSILDVTNSRAFIEKTTANGSKIFSFDLFANSSKVEHLSLKTTDFIAFAESANGAQNGFVWQAEGKTYFQSFLGDSFQLSATTCTLIKAENGMLFVEESGKIVMFNVSNGEKTTLVNEDNIKSDANLVDFSKTNKIFCFHKSEELENELLFEKRISNETTPLEMIGLVK